MKRQTEADIEILVCIPASGRARALRGHDVRYRQVARAYERFAQQSVTRTDIASTPLGTSLGTSLATTSSVPEAHRQPDTAAAPLAASALSMTFWSLSFDSVCDNVQSPRVSHAVTSQAAAAAAAAAAADDDDDDGPSPSAELLVSELKPIKPRMAAQKHSYVSPDDYIPDSQPELPVAPRARRRRLTLDDDIEVVSDAAEETRILESQDLDLDCCYGVVKDIDDIEDDDDDGGMPKEARAGSPDLSAMPVELDPLEDSLVKDNCQGQPQRVPAPAPAPARQPLSQTCENAQHIHRHDGKKDCADHGDGGHIPSSLPDEAGRVVASSTASSSYEPWSSVPVPLPKRRLAEQQQQKHRYQDLLIDDIEDADQTDAVSSFAPRPAEPNGREPAYARADKALHILSPEPPAGVSHLDAASLITERLAKLAQVLDLERRFTKAAVRETSRVKLGPFDRGYWALDTSSWPVELRVRAWHFLAKFVSRGDAGWSVWCSRRSRDDRQLRLHCFEATAGHTYLLLYLASQRQILTTGAVWMDGSGSPAITIPPRKRKDHGNGGSGRPTSRPGFVP